jgi:hypothetical protein
VIFLFADPPAASSATDDVNVSQLPAGSRLRALYDYTAQNADELSFKFDDVIVITRPVGSLEAGWLAGRLDSGVTGIFPC